MHKAADNNIYPVDFTPSYLQNMEALSLSIYIESSLIIKHDIVYRAVQHMIKVPGSFNLYDIATLLNEKGAKHWDKFDLQLMKLYPQIMDYIWEQFEAELQLVDKKDWPLAVKEEFLANLEFRKRIEISPQTKDFIKQTFEKAKETLTPPSKLSLLNNNEQE